MSDSTFHIAVEGQSGAYAQYEGITPALLDAYDLAVAGSTVTVLRADGRFNKGARIEWVPLAVISPPKAAKEASL